MANRKIHSLWNMVAIHLGNQILAVTRDAFSELVDVCLPELTQLEKVSFKMAASPIGASGLREHYKQIPSWEALLIQRLGEKLPTVGHLFVTSVSGPQVPEYLADILEGYRGNHIGDFSFAIDEIHPSNHRVLTLEAYDAPSLWQRFTKAEREPRQRLVIPVDDIASISGTSIQLEFKCRTSVIFLGKDGSIGSSRR